MPRKILISFLGTNNYLPCNYYDEEDGQQRKVESVRFVQQAISQLYCTGFTPDDVAYFFVTKEANAKNWIDNGHLDFKTKEPIEVEGLDNCLKKQNQAHQIKCVEISEGFSTADIWEIFQTIFSKIQEDDEVYFDITHAFRSLPMLGMVLINYAKVLRNITVKGIYYGAFEKLGPAPEVSKTPIAARNAPILNLVSFSELQEWTKAASSFVDTGNAQKLNDIIGQENAELGAKMLDFTNAIATCRGSEVIGTIDIKALKQLVKSTQNTTIAVQLAPLLARVEAKIEPFNDIDVNNGFAAVDWCIAHNLIQQGYTFLQETIVSYLVVKTAGLLYMNNYNYREGIMVILGSIKEYRNAADKLAGARAWNENKVNIQAAYAAKEYIEQMGQKGKLLKNSYQKLTGPSGLRNDINHCGFKNEAATADRLADELKQLTERVRECLL